MRRQAHDAIFLHIESKKYEILSYFPSQIFTFSYFPIIFSSINLSTHEDSLFDRKKSLKFEKNHEKFYETFREKLIGKFYNFLSFSKNIIAI